jgi:hypothetical protein
MAWETVRTLDDLAELAPSLGQALTGTSLDFHLPESAATHWEVERMPYQNHVLRLRPNHPVSRAWDAIFRHVLHDIGPRDPTDRGRPYRIPDQAPPPAQDPTPLVIELPDTDRQQTKLVIRAINTATDVANAVSREALQQSRREHADLARELGLNRPDVGFRP